MIEGLKPYAEYKESGQEWLGGVPSHWKVPRIKTVLQEKDARTRDGSGTLLSLTRNRGLIARSDMTEKIHGARTLAGYKLYMPGEIVMNRMQAWSGMFGAGPIAGLVSPDYAVFKALGQELVGFLLARIKAPDLVSQFALQSRGIGSGFNRLYSDRLGAITISLPPPDEQAAIVRFLDHANRKIDGFIRAKRKLIALLGEQKQVIIHRAVTRGLNPNVPLKSSGISWLGEIPAHWNIRPIKQTLRRMDYGTSESALPNGKIRVLNMGHIQSGRILIPKSGGLDQMPSGLVLERDDLLFNRTNSPELVGKVGFFEGDADSPITFASYLVRLRARSEHNPRWLNYVLNSVRFWSYARSQALVSLHQANLNCSRYGRMNIPVPPKKEQDAITNYISDKGGEVDKAIARTEREIALMQEYRTRLTADIVTGKLDVREAAAHLPDPPNEVISESPDTELDDVDDLEAEATKD